MILVIARCWLLLLMITSIPAATVRITYAQEVYGFQVGDEILYVMLTPVNDNEVPFEAKYVVAGAVKKAFAGVLFEKYDREKQPNGKYRLIDRGSSLRISGPPLTKAKPGDEPAISITWSKADATFGYLYHREGQQVHKHDRAFFVALE